MDPCIFCERIAGRRDDWAVIDEAPLSVSFVNPAQFEAGQALVIPRRHAPTIVDLTDAEAMAMMLAATRLSAAMVRAFDPDGITLYQNNGIASYQAVPHAHLHVVPRRYHSGWGEGPPHLAKLERAEREASFARLAAPIERQRELARALTRSLPPMLQQQVPPPVPQQPVPKQPVPKQP
jgi:histidine triad (HIT) family protein